MSRLTAKLRSSIRRLEQEAAVWRDEPLKRVAVRNYLLMRPIRVRQFQAFGRQSFVDRPMWLYGADHISIGERVIILRDSWLSVERTAWHKTDPVLDIRDGVAIRVGCCMSASDSILIEENVGMGASVTVVDSKHTWSSGHPQAFFSPVEAAPVRIGPGSWLADRVTITAGADIGEQCAIGSNSTVGGKIPDFSIVIGNPGRIVGSTRT